MKILFGAIIGFVVGVVAFLFGISPLGFLVVPPMILASMLGLFQGIGFFQESVKYTATFWSGAVWVGIFWALIFAFIAFAIVGISRKVK